MTFFALLFLLGYFFWALSKKVSHFVEVFHGFGAVGVSFLHAFNVVSDDSL
jgi:hypothetical protein